jgi:plastocyanin
VVREFSPIDIMRSASITAVVATVVLLAGGCGGGDTAANDAGPTTSTGTPSAAGVVLNLTGTEYAFTPAALTASPGRATIRFTNGGAVEHDFTIEALGVHLTAQPGKTVEATVTLAPGIYKSSCSVPGHLQSGMRGTLTVS